MKTELVTTLKRQATKILSELHETKEPVLITEHGKPSAYLIDFEDYESLQRRMQILEGIARGESAARWLSAPGRDDRQATTSTRIRVFR